MTETERDIPAAGGHPEARWQSLKEVLLPALRPTALLVALLATLGSLQFSGIPAIGWWGMGMAPCELCWYQRAFMYPLVPLLAYAVIRRSAPMTVPALLLCVPGLFMAAYHSLIQRVPELQVGSCGIGSCVAVMWSFLGLTIPNLALIAFATITLLLVVELFSRRKASADGL